MIVNFHAPRYQSLPQNVVAFGFASQGKAPQAETGFQQSFYWNSKLLSSSNPLVRFGQVQFGNVNVVTPPVTTTGGGAGVVIRQEPHRYSYEKYRHYKELIRAERIARERAKELKDKKKRRQLVAAADEAKQAARVSPEESLQLAETLRYAAEAQNLATMITRAIEVRRLAAEIMRRIEDEEETLLLLH